MLTILVANAKGGCGKTTIATNLAAAFARAGHKTALADADKQGSSRAWAAERPEHLPPVTLLDWTRKIAAPPKGTARLVIDSPAALKRGEIEALVEHADIVVMPVMPSIFDHGAAAGFVRKLNKLAPVKKGKKEVAIVGNRVRPRTKAAQRLEAYFTRTGKNVVARLRDTQLYPEAANEGLGLYDFSDSRTAVFRQDWQPLLAYIEDGVM